MMAAVDPPFEQAPVDGSSATRGRRLRARRTAPPLRLIEHGDGGSAASEGVALDLNTDAPIALMRLGRADLDFGVRAISAAARPTAVITGLSESRETTGRARHLTREAGVPWLSDPLLFRTGLAGY